MAVTYVDSAISGVSRQVGSAETGILVEEFTQTWENPKDMLFDNIGQAIGFAMDYNPSTSADVSGEITSMSTGLLGTAFGTPATVANLDTSQFGIDVSSADIYLEAPTVSQNRDGFKSFSATYMAWPAISGTAA